MHISDMKFPAFECGQPLAFRLTARLSDGSAVARDPATLREASVILKQHGEPRGLLAFRVGDERMRIILACSRADAGMFARYALAGLRKRLHIPVAFEPTRIRPILSERQLLRLLRALFTEEQRHGSTFDRPQDGSSLPDLLGLRFDRGPTTTRLRRLLPGLTQEIARSWLDVPDFTHAPFNPKVIEEAAAAAFGIADTHGEDPLQHAARRAMAQATAKLAPNMPIHKQLGVTLRSVQRYRLEGVSFDELRVVERQLRMRSFLVASAAGVAQPYRTDR